MGRSTPSGSPRPAGDGVVFDNRIPKSETNRKRISGKFWFPAYTIANDTLNFESGPARIRMMVKYEEYKRFRAGANITFGDAVTAEGDKKPEDKKQPQSVKKEALYGVQCVREI